MVPVLEEPAIRARVVPFTVENYHLFAELGVLTPDVELIRGILIEKIAQSPLHASLVEILREHLALMLPAGWFVRQEKPLTFSDSEPEPDLAVLRGARELFLKEHPSTADLVIEVVVSSERIDRAKLEIYAEAGIPECWLVLADQRVLERHTQPEGTAYQQVNSVIFPATLPSTIFAGLTLPFPNLFRSSGEF